MVASQSLSQRALLDSQQPSIPGGTLVERLFTYVKSHRRPIKRWFADSDKYFLHRLFGSLITLISATPHGTPEYEFLMAVVTVFPCIYCQVRRGGDTDKSKYSRFLRKRCEDPDFTAHVKYFIEQKDDEKPTADLRTTKDRVEQYARKGKASAALSALDESRIAPPSEEVTAGLQKLHPAPPPDADYSDYYPTKKAGAPGNATYFDKPNLVQPFDKADLLIQIRTMKSHAAPSLSGWTKEFFSILLHEGSYGAAEFLPHYMSLYANLALPKVVLSFLNNSFLFGLYKAVPDPKSKAPPALRPVAIPCFLNKLVWRCCLHGIDRTPQHEQTQLGDGTKAGCQAVSFAIQSALAQGKIVVLLDCSNAFNTIHRDEFLRPLFDDVRYKRIWPLLYLNYQQPCYLVTADGQCVIAAQGTRQGSVEGSFVFCKGIANIIHCPRNPPDTDGVDYAMIVDDIATIVDPDEAEFLFDTIDRMRHSLSTRGLVLNLGKTKILCNPSIVIPRQLADINCPHPPPRQLSGHLYPPRSWWSHPSGAGHYGHPPRGCPEVGALRQNEEPRS
jgi:hypothetical protein